LTEQILFDQYSRYKSCSDILKKISSSKDTILDVGSGEECLLGKFLPQNKITYVDPLLSNQKSEDKIAGYVFTEELDDRSFDFVICIDTLEHVPSDKRESFFGKVR